MKINKHITKTLKKALNLAILICLTFTISLPANARLLFESEFLLENTDNTWTIDSQDDATGDITLQFGNTLAKTIHYDTANSWFAFNDNISLEQNQLKNIVLDNLAAAPATPISGQIYHNTSDGNTYIYNSTLPGWEDITALNSTSTKVVTVGAGMDYADINSAAGYLTTLGGGIMLLSAGTHSVTAAVNISNLTIIGKGPAKTTIDFSGNGQLDTFDSTFNKLKIDVNAITDTMALDIQAGAASTNFEWVEFDIQDATDSLIDSNETTAPTIHAQFNNCTETGGTGTIFKTQALGNLDITSEILISSASGNALLHVDDWDVTIAGSGNVYTTGTLTTIPENTIYVYPGMNIQGAINSLPNGGTLTLLPGTHPITQPLQLLNDDIVFSGYGDSSILKTIGWTAGTADTIAGIQISSTDGTAPANGIVIQDLKIEIDEEIHGIRTAGGSDNRIINVTVEKTTGTSGTGATARMGIQMLDGASTNLIRPVVQNSRVLGSAAASFTDGIHVTSDGTLGGVWGYGNRVENALIEGNNINYIQETGLVFLGVDDSSLFNNRVSRMGASGGFGIYIGSVSNANMSANVFSGSLSNATIAIGIDAFGTGTETIDSIFNNNIIDGEANGGAGFRYGFQVGSGTLEIKRNSFQSNTIKGASIGAGNTSAIIINGESDNNTFSNNDIYGGTNPWTTGIEIQGNTQNENLIRGNRFVNVTTNITDAGTDTKNGVSQHKSTTDPTATDDTTTGYGTGTMWTNTTTDSTFISVDDTATAAVWKEITTATALAPTRDITLDINGGVRTSATTGSVGGGHSPVIRFNAADNSRIRWSFPVPSDWNGTSDLTTTIYWSPSNTTTGDIDFDLEFASIAIGETVAGGSFLDQIPGATYSTVNSNTELNIYELTIVLPSGSITTGDMIDVRFSRTPTDAGDTYAGDINIHMAKVSYTSI